MNAQKAPKELCALTRELIFSRNRTALAPFLPLWPTVAAEAAIGTAAVARPLPVLRWLSGIAGGSRDLAGSLVAALCRSAPTLAWRQTYTAADLGADFIANYGYTEMVGPNAPLPSERIACGFLILGPATLYPRHRHEAEEIYIPLGGGSEWLQGDGIWRERSPGTVIHHASHESHAMRAGAAPLVALYLWRSADLSQKARLDCAATPVAGEH